MQKHGIDFALKLPHKPFNRQISSLAGIKVSPDGRVVSAPQREANRAHRLASAADREFVQSLMGLDVEPSKFANWIAPPPTGINDQPLDFEYGRF
jgi:benzoyl-CoA 2,3-epoxidase subunit B